jgi:hypothetical protein
MGKTCSLHADVRNPCTILPEKHQDKKPLGKPGPIWEDDIKMGVIYF